ncbi:hypothetical protein [Burkholderia pseudomallei]|uniref:hypothetical protein n=1 Tax=Burkholderia pseudomallei TaxID=28450 RepID=UPI0019402C50|nr:hypothetical protein [Burkholderia pseudomallei]MBM5584977.1 hypothetical protein [Burkholderia pseudomallei]
MKPQLVWLVLLLPVLGYANPVCTEIPEGARLQPYVIEDVQYKPPGYPRAIYAVTDGEVLWVRFDTPPPWPRPYTPGPKDGADLILDWHASKDCLTVTKDGHYADGKRDGFITFPELLYLAQDGRVTRLATTPFEMPTPNWSTPATSK